MTIESLFTVAIIITTLLVALVAGIVFAFSVITMPGIKRLNDKEFIRGFQVIDGVIQDNQPLFILVWVGSIISIIISAGIGVAHLEGTPLIIMIVATVL